MIKKGLFLLLPIVISFNVNAQWSWVYPKPTEKNLSSIFRFENTAFVVGSNGIILKSTNNGINWVILNSGLIENLNSIYFTDVQHGFAVGDNGTIIKTTDGGSNWINSSGVTNKSLLSVFFTDPQKGFCCGNDGTFLTTTNAGDSWENIGFIDNYADLKSMYFTTTNTGYISAYYISGYYVSSRIYKTTNSGYTWTQLIEDGNLFYDIQFTDTTTGYVGSSSGIFKTTDSGNNWIALNIVPAPYFSISFPTNEIGYAAYFTDDIIKTTDAGNSWTKLNVNLTSGICKSLFFIDSYNGIGVGEFGLIFKTTDGGNTWEKINKGSDYFFSSIRCFDSEICYAGGVNWVYTPNPEAGGIIIKTTDGGDNWTIVKSRDNDSWSSIYMIDDHTVFASSNYGNIIKTNDGGDNWTWLNTGTSAPLTSIYFPTSDVGFAVGLYGTIIKTTDSGNSWDYITMGNNINFQDVFFTDENTGYVVSGWPSGTPSEPGIIYKTSDAGNNWIQLNNDTEKSLLCVNFPSPNVGYAAGQDCRILKTTDSGFSWNILTGLLSEYEYIYSLWFVNDNTGFAVMSNGKICKTTDGGTSWSLYDIGTNTQLWSVHFSDPNTGFVAGNIGIILRTTNGGVTFIENEELSLTQSKEFSLQQNFPNPFNLTTTINYSVHTNGRMIRVTIKVFDILGNEVATLVNKEKPGGEYEVKFDASKLSSGIYFYRLTSGSFIQTKKMVLLK